MVFNGVGPWVCPAGGQHDLKASANYSMYGSSCPYPSQGGFRWCNKCAVMFLAGSPNKCPATGGAHDNTGGTNYIMPTDQIPILSQDHWRACSKCQVLFYGDSGGVCPAGAPGTSTPHVATSAGYSAKLLFSSAALAVDGDSVLRFDGATAHAALPTMNPDFSQGLTIEAWVRYDAFNSWSRILDAGNGASSDNIIFANSGTTSDLALSSVRGSTSTDLVARGALEIGKWLHLCATIDASGTGRIYKNGVLVASGAVQLPNRIQRNNNYIGKSNWTNDSFLGGQMGELRLWTYARSAEQIAGAMQRRLAGDEAGLFVYYRFDDVAGAVVRDASGNGRHARLNGEASWVRGGLALNAPLPELSVTSFGGASDAVALPALSYDISGGFTAEAWVLLRPGGNWGRIFMMSNAGSHVFLLLGGEGSSFGVAIAPQGAGELALYSAAATLEMGAWIHIAATVDSTGKAQLYKNGQPLGASGQVRLPAAGAAAYGSAMISNSACPFVGQLAEARVWGRARSQAEIQSAMGHRLVGSEEGLLGYWKLDDATGTVVRDSTAGAKHGARVGNCAGVAAQLPLEARRARVTSVTHEGKVVVFATRPDGSVQYTVKQSGFEDTIAFAAGQEPGWEDWKSLTLPQQDDDTSVLAREAKELAYNSDPNRFVLRSRYRTAALGAFAAVQAVSGFGYLNVFRQSLTGTLLVHRFVLDGMTNTLVPALEVRFKRSRKRYEPLQPSSTQSQDLTFDALDFTDTNGDSFCEPSMELCLASGIHDGAFAVVLLSTADADRQRWHVFTHNGATGKVEVISIRSTENGLFDPRAHVSTVDGSPLPGIERSVIDLGLGAVVRSLSATRYDLQEEQATVSGKVTLIRTAVRVMLVADTAQGTAALSFAVASDGTLSRLADTPTQSVLHSEERELILPLDTLENVKVVHVDPPISAPILGMLRGSDDNVVIQSANAGLLSIGDSVQIQGTASYDERFTVTGVSGDSFEIAVSWVGSELGRWQKVTSSETGLTFDGAITSCVRSGAGKLQVTAQNHGLAIGDAVQVVGTTDYNDVYPVTPIDANSFSIDTPWAVGSALNIKRLASQRRRGITLNGAGEHVKVPSARVPTGNSSFTVEAWIRPTQMGAFGILGWGNYGAQNQVNALRLTPNGLMHYGWGNDLAAPTAALTDGWHHVAASYDAVTGTRRLYLDGVKLLESQATAPLAVPASVTNFTLGVTNTAEYFPGSLGEVRVWSLSRSPAQIGSAMFQQLSGREEGLVGYWKLGIISEGASRTVYDFSPSQTDGQVQGNAYVSSITLPNTHTAGTEYRNDDAIAVTRGAIYQESVEARAVGGPLPAFKLAYWFKKSNDSIVPDVTLPPVTPTVTDLGNGWSRVSCQLAVPQETSLMRTFEITEVADGAWTALELRKHRVVQIPAAITEWGYTASPALKPTSAAPADLDTQLAALADGERAEASLVLEKQVLEGKIALASSSTLDAQIAQAEQALATLRAQRVPVQATRDAQVASRLPFYCRYTPVSAGNMALVVINASQDDAAGVYQLPYHGTDNELFAWAQSYSANGAITTRANVSDGYGWIIAKHSNKVFDVYGGSTDNADINQYYRNGESGNQLFRPEAVGTGVYKFRAQHSGKILDVARGTADGGEHIIQHDQYGDSGDPNQRFTLTIVAESHVTLPIKNQLADFDRRITDQSQVIAQLRDAKQASTTQRAAWQARLDAINNVELVAARGALDPIHSRLLGAVLQDQATAPRLPELRKDSRKLATLGALLPFVRPSGRLTALQTCDGDVELSYFDARGRQREARYQATRDSSGAGFEQWRPTSIRAALDFRTDTSVVTFGRPIALADAWTIEAWVYAPLPKNAQINTLVQGVTDGDHVIVSNDLLGTWLPGIGFYDCGFDTKQLERGWHHITAVAGGNGESSTIAFYVDGKRVGDLRSTAQQRANGDQTRLNQIKSAVLKCTNAVTAFGNSVRGGAKRSGRMAEVRIWGLALKDAEIDANSRSLLTGREPGLLAYYPLTEGQGAVARDGSGNGNDGAIAGAAWIALSAPIGRHVGEDLAEAIVTAEYDTIGVNPATRANLALMRRGFAVETPRGVKLRAEQRVEELDLRWVGNVQFDPTLLGYIEGAPPVPSENLTMSDDYNNAAAVELTMADDVSYSWDRAKTSSLGASSDIFVGVDVEWEEGTAMGIFFAKKEQVRAGFKTSVESSSGDTSDSAISAQSGVQTTDRFGLRGTREEKPHFPHLGNRFIPKNVGYALVISSTADLFITSLKRSGRMIGYEVVPDANIPPDVNTITFLINPAYTMSGSLDGLTGSSPTSDRFFAQIPAMRAQYGSRVAASYFRVAEAYQLKAQIDEQDRAREAYFFNFDTKLQLLTQGGSDKEISRAIDGGSSPATISTGSQATPSGSGSAATQAPVVERDQETEDAVEARQAQIEKSFADRELQANASLGLKEWQVKMQDLRIKAGKRNIVNTYVWDADGGLHLEQQQFASSVSHTLGNVASTSQKYGGDFKVSYLGPTLEANALATMTATQTMTKTVSNSRGFSLNVSLDGVESRGVTDYNDRPLFPGEKVGRYRFMSFYLEGATQHFRSFFSDVVDPEWLAGNSESARALRQVKQGQPSKPWRILHRVTYVERPALANFGAEVRPLQSMAAPTPQLDERVTSLEKKLDLALKILQTKLP